MNPLSRLLAGILAVLALAGAFFFGVFVLGLVAGLGLIAWLVFSIRMWWLRKKFAGNLGGMGGMDSQNREQDAGADNGDIIEAEYTVVSRKDED
jgi:hypothetical protein